MRQDNLQPLVTCCQGPPAPGLCSVAAKLDQDLSHRNNTDHTRNITDYTGYDLTEKNPN